MEKKTQACPPATVPITADAFADTGATVIRWLGNAGGLINCRGTNVLLDPLLLGFDMPLLIDIPMAPDIIPHLDAVLITHGDSDHYDVATCKALKDKCSAYHSTKYVSELMRSEGLKAFGHNIRDSFNIGEITITLTPADHAWQNDFPPQTRVFKPEDCCGFWLETPDGILWAPGDSRLLPQQLQMPTPDAMLFDFSDDSWHIGLDGAVALANNYPNTPLLLYHWGSVDAPDMKAFNADPEQLKGRIKNQERIKILAPGQPFVLRRI